MEIKYKGQGRYSVKVVDPIMGLGIDRNKPLKFAVLKEGVYLIENEMLAELTTIGFEGMIPVMQSGVPPTIKVSNWKDFPENTPLEGYYDVKFTYGAGHSKVFNVPFSAYWWDVMNIDHFKPVGEPDSHNEPNPDFEPQEALIEEYKQLLKTTLSMMCWVKFPGLPDGFTWYIDGIEIPYDPDHWLRVAIPGEKVYKLIPYDLGDAKWDSIVSATWGMTNEDKINHLTR